MRDLEKPAIPRRLFVQPQHMELRDRYHERFLDETLRLLAPYAWGIERFALDIEGLQQGVLRLNEVVARFRSGEVATIGKGSPPLEISFAPKTLADGPLDVWLGLADWSSEGPSVGDERSAATRYTRILSSGNRPVLRPRLRLFATEPGDLPEDCIRIARVRGAGRGIDVDADVLPPAFWPLEGTFLPGALAGIVSALGRRQSQLLAARRDRPHEPLTFRAGHVPQLLALSTLNQALAALTSPTSTRGLEPWEAHRILSELLGAIDATEGRLSTLPTYEHESPGPGFRVLVDRLLAAIPGFAQPPHDSFTFTRKDAHTFELRLPDVATLRRPLYLVLVGADRGTLEQGVPTYAKLASDGWMDRIRQTAIRGIDLAPDFDPPASLPNSNHSACFRLNTRSEHWADVVERRNLLFYLPNAGASLEATLYVTRPSGS